MGKIVMPKNSALLDEVEAVLKIYYEAGGCLKQHLFKSKLLMVILLRIIKWEMKFKRLEMLLFFHIINLATSLPSVNCL